MSTERASSRPRPGRRLILAAAATVLVAAFGASTAASAGNFGEAVTSHRAVVQAEERLAKALAEVDAKVAKAEEKAAKDLAKAAEELAEAEEKAAKDLAKATDKSPSDRAKAEEKAAKDLAGAAKELAEAEEKAAKDLAKATAEANRKVTEAEQDLATALREAWLDVEDEAATKSLSCTSRNGYSAVRSVGSLYNVVDHINADDAWARGHTGDGIDVAVIDTGVVPVTGLAGDKVIYGPDFSLEGPRPEVSRLDTYGHGTHIAGIIAGNDVDTAVEAPSPHEFQGVAPDARIVSVKVADQTGAVDVSQVIAAIDWVIDHRNADGLDIRVLNLSYRAAGDQPYTIDPLAKAVERAWEAGIVVVVAAGNDGKKAETLGNPAYDPFVIAVSAILEDAQKANKDGCLSSKVKWETTSYATKADKKARQADLFAPGSSIVSLRNPGSTVDQAFPGSAVAERHTTATGTSQSAAVVSGAVALLLDARPELTPDEVKAILIESAQDKKTPMIDVAAAIAEKVPGKAAQDWERSRGSGSLEAARGGEHVVIDGQPVTGEYTVWGPWEPEAWLAAGSGAETGTWTGSSWTGSSWTGSSWTGSSWTGSSWTGSSWTGSSWTGSSWTGSSWTGSSWTGSSWTGSSWTGSSWTGSSWTGSSWTGSSWTGSSWG